MRIQVTNISTLDSTELEGHEAPILGLSLDPKEEFVVCILCYIISEVISLLHNALGHLKYICIYFSFSGIF